MGFSAITLFYRQTHKSDQSLQCSQKDEVASNLHIFTICASGMYVKLSFFFSSTECKLVTLLVQQTSDQYPYQISILVIQIKSYSFFFPCTSFLLSSTYKLCIVCLLSGSMESTFLSDSGTTSRGRMRGLFLKLP